MALNKVMLIFCGITFLGCINTFAQPIGIQGVNTDFQEMDADKNGFITLEEMQQYQEKKFKELDKDKNGEISAEELKADKTKIFDKADKNNDKKISRQEAFNQINEDFNKMDSDKDNRISKEEFKDYWPVIVKF